MACTFCSPTDSLVSFHPTPQLQPMPFSLPHAASPLPTVLSVAVQSYLLQDLPWPRTELSTSAQGLTIGSVFFALHLPRTWERAACMASSSTKPRMALSGQSFSLCLPSTHGPQSHAGNEQVNSGWEAGCVVPPTPSY